MTRHTRHTLSRHARLRQPGFFRQIAPALAAAIVTVVVAAAGVAAYFAIDLTSSISNNAVDIGNTTAPPPELGAYPGAFTLLVIGTDECDDSIKDFIGVDRCSGDEAEHHLNDVNIMLHVSAEPRRVSVVSFPRDLRVERAECTDDDGNVTSGTAKINTAYEAGGTANGLKCVADTVAAETGIPIDFAAKLSFIDVIGITNAVGGVPVCVGGDGIVDPYTGLDLAPGMHTIQGGPALQFLRTRHGLKGGSDLSRISNQQQYMSSLIRTLRSADTLSDPVKLINLATVIAKNMTADKQLANPIRMAQLALSIKDVPYEDIRFVSWPVADANDGTGDVLTVQSTADTLLDAIKNNQPFDLTRTGGGVETPTTEETTAPTDEATDGTTDPAETPTEPGDGTDPSPTPTGPVTLDWAASGQTAAQQTCSAGVEY